MKDLARAAKQMSLEEFLAMLTDGEKRDLTNKSGSPEHFWLRRNGTKTRVGETTI